MEKYVVKITNLFSTFVEVDAENEEQARNIAKESLQNEDKELEYFYEGTMPLEESPVAKKSELEKAIIEKEKQEDNKL